MTRQQLGHFRCARAHADRCRRHEPDHDHTYDKNGNTLTMTPPRRNATTHTYDALNRLATARRSVAGRHHNHTYDSHNRVLSVKDANLNTTSYVYDGFGDRTQTASPDSGTTVYHYDPDRNLTQRVHARQPRSPPTIPMTRSTAR